MQIQDSANQFTDAVFSILDPSSSVVCNNNGASIMQISPITSNGTKSYSVVVTVNSSNCPMFAKYDKTGSLICYATVTRSTGINFFESSNTLNYLTNISRGSNITGNYTLPGLDTNGVVLWIEQNVYFAIIAVVGFVVFGYVLIPLIWHTGGRKE